MSILLLAGLLLSLSGCVGLYLTSSHQRWLASPWPAKPTRTIGLVLIAVSLVPLLRVLLPATAVFVLITWVMLLLTLMPYIDALLHGFQGDNTHGTR